MNLLRSPRLFWAATAVATFSLMATGCGSDGSDLPPDAAADADTRDAPTIDANVDASIGYDDTIWDANPATTPRYEWQVEVEPTVNGDRILERLILTPSGVIVLTDIEAVSYDDAGTEIGRVPVRDWTYGDLSVFQGSVVVNNRVYLAFTHEVENSSVVVSFAADDLSDRQFVSVPEFGYISIASYGAAVHLFVSSDNGTTRYTLGSSKVSRATVITDALGSGQYLYSRDGIELENGLLLFCARERFTDEMKLIYVDMAVNTLSTTSIGATPQLPRACNLTRGRDTMIATWIGDRTQKDGILVSPIDGSVVRPANPGPMESRNGVNADAAFDDDDWLRITWTGNILRFDATTVEPLTTYRFDFPTYATPFYGSASIVGNQDGTNVYAALPYHIGFGPVVLMLQKLEPISGP